MGAENHEPDEMEALFTGLTIAENELLTHTVGTELLQAIKRPKITTDQLIGVSQSFINAVMGLNPQAVTFEDYQRYSKVYKDLRTLYANPILVSNARVYGGLRVVYKHFEKGFLAASRNLARIGLCLGDEEINLDPMKLNSNQYDAVIKGFGKLVKQFKLKSAYAGFRQGKKFQKSSQIEQTSQGLLLQANPIAQLSRKNIETLKVELKITGDKGKLYGLRKDEETLFKLLLNLPWRCQHATNFFYPVVNSGSLDSYKEIQRARPEYVSPFSTNGNIDKLGNGGFVFFRVFVEGVNSSKSRYGASRIFAPLSIFSQIGCVSLHDELIPFTSAGELNMRDGNRLLRRAETININNTTKEKSLRDGIRYKYRVTPISTSNPLGGKKDKVGDFTGGKVIATQVRNTSFTAEMFYGQDILLGITLSVIRELRWLEACGYRNYFLKKLEKSNESEQIILIGNLVKSLFRIEAKYPVGLRLSLTNDEQRYHFEPLISQNEDQIEQIAIDNPEGEGQYNSDLSINEQEMRLVLLKQERYRLEGKLSVLRRKAKNNRLKAATRLVAQQALDNTKRRYESVKEEIYSIEHERDEAEDYFKEHFDLAFDLDAIDTPKLLFIYNNFFEMLDEEYIEIDIDELFNTPLNKLELIAGGDYLMEYLNDELVSFSELAALRCDQLQALGDCSNLQVAIVDYGYSLHELMNLYDKDPLHLECLTTDDLTDLVLDYAPEIPKLVLEYARDQDVDLHWVRNQLCETDAMIMGFDMYR